MKLTSDSFPSFLVLQSGLIAENAIEIAAATGLSGLYVDCALPGNAPWSWSSERLDRFRQRALDLDLTVLVHGNPRAPLCSELDMVRAASVSYVSTEVDLASKLGASLVVHGGTLYCNMGRTEASLMAMRLLTESLKEIVKAASERNVAVLFENLPAYELGPFRTLGGEVDELKRLLADVTGLTIALDIGHANLGTVSVVEVLSDLLTSVSLIVVSDNAGGTDDHLIVGRGTVPIVEIVQVLRASAWRGPIVFECHEGTVAEAVDAFREVVRRVESL